MILILEETEQNRHWQLHEEGNSDSLGAIDNLGGGKWRLHRLHYGLTTVDADELAVWIKSWFPEARRIEVVGLDGSRRTMKQPG